MYEGANRADGGARKEPGASPPRKDVVDAEFEETQPGHP
jgi:hypothetical protein